MTRVTIFWRVKGVSNWIGHQDSRHKSGQSRANQGICSHQLWCFLSPSNVTHRNTKTQAQEGAAYIKAQNWAQRKYPST